MNHRHSVAAFTIATIPARTAVGTFDHAAITAANSRSVGLTIPAESLKTASLLPDLLPPGPDTPDFPAGNRDGSNPLGVIQVRRWKGQEPAVGTDHSRWPQPVRQLVDAGIAALTGSTANLNRIFTQAGYHQADLEWSPFIADRLLESRL